MSNLRRRGNVDDGVELEHVSFLPIMFSAKPSAALLLSLIPHKAGVLLKKTNSWLHFFFPWCTNPWRSRLCVLIGGYLYKFESEHSERPKGVPIPIESITPAFTETEDGFILEIKTIRKTYTFRGTDRADCLAWISALEDRKHLSIKEKMGHAPLQEEIIKLNKAAQKIFDEKLRLEGAEISNMEIFNPMVR